MISFDPEKLRVFYASRQWIRLTFCRIFHKKLTKTSKNSCDRETLLTLDTDICHFHTGSKTESRYMYNLDITFTFTCDYGVSPQVQLDISQESKSFSNMPFTVQQLCVFLNCSTITFSSLSHHRIIDTSFSGWVEMVQIIIVPLADAQFMHNQFSLRCFQLSKRTVHK